MLPHGLSNRYEYPTWGVDQSNVSLFYVGFCNIRIIKNRKPSLISSK